MKYLNLMIIMICVALQGCATSRVQVPDITLDLPVEVEPIPDPPAPVEVVMVPEPLPLPGQLMPAPDISSAAKQRRRDDPSENIAAANSLARVAPRRDAYVNAVQVWPYSTGALYQLYVSPGRVSVIALQPGEELVALAAGDTARWVVGDSESGSGEDRHVVVLIKPTRADLMTNLVITTTRRTYLLELTSTEGTWMASASWHYPHDQIAALRQRAQRAQSAAPVDEGIAIDRLRFRYSITGDAPWKPLRAFDDGAKVYVQFPAGIAQGELPPLFVLGPQGDAQLVNSRWRAPYYIVDRLFRAGELRLGTDHGHVVRIERTDGVRRNRQ